MAMSAGTLAGGGIVATKECQDDENAVDIAIIGGGIAGLYCCLKLGQTKDLKIQGQLKKTPKIRLYEALDHFGGRIETWSLKIQSGDEVKPLDDDKQHRYDPDADYFRAEFGPMRIEPRDQPKLKALLDDIGIKQASGKVGFDSLVSFPSYAAEEPTEPKFTLAGEEAEQRSLLDMLLLAIRRIFELVKPPNSKWNWTKTQGHPAQGHRAGPHWEKLMDQSPARHRYWKAELRDWIRNLGDEDYQNIREASLDKIPLWDMGFWNLLATVLSHYAVLKLRDWASFYHLLPENPNAAEWLVFWLRAIKSSGSLRGVHGGMGRIVDSLENKINELKRGGACIDIEHDCELEALTPNPDDSITLILKRLGTASPPVIAKEVILALPKRPLEKLGLPKILGEQIGIDDGRAEKLRQALDAVFGFPLLKCFFIIDQPWWEDDRPLNRHASDLPTRELQYLKSKDKTKGMIMVYTDRPATQFWTDYLPSKRDEEPSSKGKTSEWLCSRSNIQKKANTWLLTFGPDHVEQVPKEASRLWERFVQYARDYEHNDFASDRLLACGIRDWGKDPFGGAAHAWRPGVKSRDVIDYLKEFSLTKRNRIRNIHVCGEAYSDYQGFIEGALRSADGVIKCFVS
jgi:hypothetical protein